MKKLKKIEILKIEKTVEDLNEKIEKNKKIRIKWPQIAHHSSRIRAHRVHHRPFF